MFAQSLSRDFPPKREFKEELNLETIKKLKRKPLLLLLLAVVDVAVVVVVVVVVAVVVAGVVVTFVSFLLR